MSARIVFLSSRLLREFRDCDARLQEVLLDLAERFWPDERWDVRVTCIHRTAAEETAAGGISGIHTQGPPHRAIDVGGANLTQEQLNTLADALNARWQYDPTRPDKLVCFVAPHGTGPHAHLQVCATTQLRL